MARRADKARRWPITDGVDQGPLARAGLEALTGFKGESLSLLLLRFGFGGEALIGFRRRSSV